MPPQIGGQSGDTTTLKAVRNFLHPAKLHFGTLGGPAAQVALATLRPHDFPCACHTEPLGGCLVCLEFKFLAH